MGGFTMVNHSKLIIHLNTSAENVFLLNIFTETINSKILSEKVKIVEEGDDKVRDKFPAAIEE